MADRRQHLAAKLLGQPVQDMIQSGGGIAELCRPPCLVDQALSVLGFGGEMGIGADAFDLALDAPLEPLTALPSSKS